jgi:dipeptidyl aminopeptidase/acylaminoacyl peptidase
MRKAGSTLRCLALIACALGIPAGTWAAEALTPEAVLTLRRVTDPQIAPDGRQVVFVVSGLNEARVEDSEIWLVGSDGKGLANLSNNPGSDTCPRWRPDGAVLAFVQRAAGAGENVIRTLSLKDRRATTLPTAGGVIDFAWAPDGRSIAMRRPDPVPPELAERRARGDDATVVGEYPLHTGLWLLDPATGALRRLSAPGRTVWSYGWAPKGDRIALLSSTSPIAEGQEYGSALSVIEVATGTERVLATRTNPHAAPSFSPDGAQIAYLGPVGEFLERGVPHVVSTAGGEARAILRSVLGNVWDLRFLPNKPVLLAGVGRGVENPLVLVDLEGSMRDVVTTHHALTPYWDDCFTVSGDGTRIAFVSEQGSVDAELWVARIDGKGATRLTGFNDALRSFEFGSVEQVSWSNPRDQLALNGVLVKPPTFTRGVRYPLVAWLHGGPAYGWGLAGHVRSWAQLMAAQGYLVFLPNFRGSAGAGMDLMMANVRDWGDGPLSDVLSGVDHLVAQGLADPDRLLVGGGSYGGYLTLWAITHSSRFKAAFVRAGVADLATEYTTTDEPTFELGYFRATPWDDPDFYRRSSPVTHASGCKTPLLIIHGERDLRVPVAQGLQMHAVLRHHGARVEMVTYPREGHSIREPAHQLDVMRRMLAHYRAALP